MPQEFALKRALEILINSYKSKIETFTDSNFLRTGVDPFRFAVNTTIFDLKKAIRKEIEHKCEMALENAIGDFHENYLGNCIHLPTRSKWIKVPNGTIRGIDIKNEHLKVYLQIKSKHNSMNSSSSSKLAQELKAIIADDAKKVVGCAWVIAWQNKSCIGEKAIAPFGKVLKGKKAYEFVTGNPNEMDEVIESLPNEIFALLEEQKIDFNHLLDNSAERVALSLSKKAKSLNSTVNRLLYEQSVN